MCRSWRSGRPRPGADRLDGLPAGGLEGGQRGRAFIEQMGSVAASMWRQAVDCWRERDRSAAAALDEHDDEMDELYASLMAELGSGGMSLPVTMEMTLVARFYERLGDHAVNIARRVVYLAGSAPR